MKTVKVYQYRVKDPITGRRYVTRYKLTEEEATKRYPERERLETTEEIRKTYDDGEIHSSHQLVFGGPTTRARFEGTLEVRADVSGLSYLHPDRKGT